MTSSSANLPFFIFVSSGAARQYEAKSSFLMLQNPAKTEQKRYNKCICDTNTIE